MSEGNNTTQNPNPQDENIQEGDWNEEDNNENWNGEDNNEDWNGDDDNGDWDGDDDNGDWDGDDDNGDYEGGGDSKPSSIEVFSLEYDSDDDFDLAYSRLRNIENGFKAYMYGIECNLLPNKNFEVRIPRTFLPITLQVAYGFMQNEIAFDLTVEISGDWNSPYSRGYVKHPVTGQIYTGSVLVKDAISNFFKEDYQPKSYYRSAPYFFYSSTTPDPSKVSKIVEKGFTEMQAKRTLSLCRNNIEESLTFLRTGQINMAEHLEDAKPPVSYKENPLIYLVLEIADSIYDVQDHCSICREPIPPGIKPASCEKESCKFVFGEMGIGISVIQEIKRDIFVSDLLYTSFMSALETDFLTPAPPNFNVAKFKKLIKRIPPIMKIITFQDDLALCDAIGQEAFHLLRWIILSNRSQLFYLPPKIQLPMLSSNGCFQFMALISSPDQEEIFQQLKKKYTSIFVWHGSPNDRWHSIIRNGLINATNTKLMRVGAAYGPGIYLAKNSNISLSYAVGGNNPCNQSKLGRNFNVIALCEVIKLPDKKEMNEEVYVRDTKTGKRVKKTIHGKLSDFGEILTLTMEEACIVRFVIVNLQQRYDIYSNPPSKLPTLVDVLEAHAQKEL